MIWIVYKTINKINNKIYIGVHKQVNEDFDGYIGCGVYQNDKSTYSQPKTHFQYAVHKYGVDAFTRITLKVFDNEIDALDLEAWLVTKDFVKDPNTYNMELGGGKIWKPLNSKEVHVYDLEGNFVKTCLSQSDASRYIYGHIRCVGTINRAIKTGQFCKTYQVSDIKYPFMKNYKDYKKEKYNKIVTTIEAKYAETDNPVLQFTRAKKVGQYSLDGVLVKIWDSQTQCCKHGKFTNVQAVLEGKRKTCKGYTFKYIED